MIQNRLPKDMNFVPPMDVIVDSIERLEEDVELYKAFAVRLDKSLAKILAKLNDLQKDFDLIKKYCE